VRLRRVQIPTDHVAAERQPRAPMAYRSISTVY
jgi:hypothetical protein